MRGEERGRGLQSSPWREIENFSAPFIKHRFIKTVTMEQRTYSHHSFFLVMYSFHINLALVNQPLKYNQLGDPNSDQGTDNSSHREQTLLYKHTHT